MLFSLPFETDPPQAFRLPETMAEFDCFRWSCYLTVFTSARKAATSATTAAVVEVAVDRMDAAGKAAASYAFAAFEKLAANPAKAKAQLELCGPQRTQQLIAWGRKLALAMLPPRKVGNSHAPCSPDNGRAAATPAASSSLALAAESSA